MCPMQQSCTNCGENFEVMQEDLAFLESISPQFGEKKYQVPPPLDCPPCRHQRRCMFRNERNLFTRECGLCGKSTVNVFSGDRSFPVFCTECWWSDKWDGEKYGREVDFSRPFFDQLRDLQEEVPRLALNNINHENSEYCNQCIGNKNCYLLFAADENEDCMYDYWINRCKDTFNSAYLADSTLCAEVLDSEKCYNCIYCQDLVNCSDCFFSYNLIGCKNCFGCASLRNKEYHYF